MAVVSLSAVCTFDIFLFYQFLTYTCKKFGDENIFVILINLVIQGGDNADVPSDYNPFYITDDAEGGQEAKSVMERQVNIFLSFCMIKIVTSISTFHPILTKVENSLPLAESIHTLLRF